MTRKSAPVSASQITTLLAARHSKDIFVPECKAGPSTTGHRSGAPRMDAWVLKGTWQREHAICYEIKVSRGDFLADEKWQKYLPFCNQFYFVAPGDVMDPSEVPAEAGLLRVSSNVSRVFVKKKAPHMPMDAVDRELVLRYVLMWRATIGRERYYTHDRESNRAFWLEWLKDRDLDKSLGGRVSQALSAELQKLRQGLESENRALKARINGLEEIQRLCDELQIRPSGWDKRSKLEQHKRIMEGAVPESILRAVRNAKTAIGDLLKELEAK